MLDKNQHAGSPNAHWGLKQKTVINWPTPALQQLATYSGWLQ